MSKFLNTCFVRHPLVFFDRYMLRIPAHIGITPGAAAIEFTLQLAPGIWALDLSSSPVRSVQVVDLMHYDDVTGYFRGNPRGRNHAVGAFWMPENRHRVSTVKLNSKHAHLFMNALSGCSLAISHGFDNVVHLSPPEHRVRLINTLIPAQSPNLKFSHFTPERHYDSGGCQTVFFGLRSRCRRKWRFYHQTTQFLQNSDSEFGRFREDGYQYVRFCKNVEFSIPFT